MNISCRLMAVSSKFWALSLELLSLGVASGSRDGC